MKASSREGAPTTAGASEARSLLVKDAIETAGASWALECMNELRAGGRPIEGGWPGTLPEARARIMRKLSAQGLLPLDAHEVGLLATSTNAEAKRSWQLAAKRRPAPAV